MDVQRQHTQVSAKGDMEPLHVGTLLEALSRMVHIPPEAFVVRTTRLHRSDDDAARAVEQSDSQWSNVRRTREQIRLTVRTEQGRTQLLLPQPPAPPGAAPTVAVRSVVIVDDMTPSIPAPAPPALDGSSIFALPMEDLARCAMHCDGWQELVTLLNWTPADEHMQYGLRYVLLSESPLVLHELRIFRSVEWAMDGTNRPMEWTPSSILHVQAISTLRSDVGAGVPKQQQDDTARALQYAIQHMQRLQKALDAVVPLHRDA
ncbi:hypothetical protein MCAP1_002674 [Malassezia caprae]|uniref:Uncharacterized protein n=1 Tax=Malassezia caprae TaxID=1381934 RepID=A0AAF0E7T1_9BASI|nr:hypothetical protein MCAP1_002674 [Malassezia caprae]